MRFFTLANELKTNEWVLGEELFRKNNRKSPDWPNNLFLLSFRRTVQAQGKRKLFTSAKSWILVQKPKWYYESGKYVCMNGNMRAKCGPIRNGNCCSFKRIDVPFPLRIHRIGHFHLFTVSPSWLEPCGRWGTAREWDDGRGGERERERSGEKQKKGK